MIADKESRRTQFVFVLLGIITVGVISNTFHHAESTTAANRVETVAAAPTAKDNDASWVELQNQPAVSDAAVIVHADRTAAEVTAAIAADPLHDHFPKPDPAFFNSLSDRQMELWEKEFKQRRLQGQMQRQRTPKGS